MPDEPQPDLTPDEVVEALKADLDARAAEVLVPDAIIVDPDEQPYGVLSGGACGTGKFSIAESDKSVDVLVLTLAFTPYDRLTAEPMNMMLVIDPADADSLIGSITKAKDSLAVQQEEADARRNPVE